MKKIMKKILIISVVGILLWPLCALGQEPEKSVIPMLAAVKLQEHQMAAISGRGLNGHSSVDQPGRIILWDETIKETGLKNIDLPSAPMNQMTNMVSVSVGK